MHLDTLHLRSALQGGDIIYTWFNIHKSDPKPTADEELPQLKKLCVCSICTSAIFNNFKIKG